MSQNRSSLTINLLFGFSFISASASIGLSVVLYLWGFMGFTGTPNLSFTACTYQYHTVKYSDLTFINQIIFVGSAAAAAFGTLVFFVSLCLLITKCKSEQKDYGASVCTRNMLYLFVCPSILGSVIEVGYYVGFVVQGKNCSFSYDSTQITAFVFLGATVLICSLLVFLIVTCCLQVQEQIQEYNQLKETKLNDTQLQKKEQTKYQVSDEQKQYRSKVINEDQNYLREEQKRYLNSYNNRTPILRAEQDTYGQRDRYTASGGRMNDSYGERDRKMTRTSHLDKLQRNLEKHYKKPTDEYQPVMKRVESPEKIRTRERGNRYY